MCFNRNPKKGKAISFKRKIPCKHEIFFSMKKHFPTEYERVIDEIIELVGKRKAKDVKGRRVVFYRLDRVNEWLDLKLESRSGKILTLHLWLWDGYIYGFSGEGKVYGCKKPRMNVKQRKIEKEKAKKEKRKKAKEEKRKILMTLSRRGDIL
ncbi:hypothetical protein Tsubulata_012694 [Turnera subulata]|uniref:Uncharacterized protein n=1 Tax=Turnera subulata TaxID=218843 RepID=A0A9Q0FY82_9ROSI|nr:hypothetical protein Tsubulata_012694 [Turnera subulata]